MTFALIFIAAFFNAIMDSIENEVAFDASIFHDFDRDFWLKSESWKHAKTVLNYRLDGWHLCKSSVIVALLLGIITYQPIINPLIDFVLLGITWNIVFEVLYAHLFKRK